MAEQEREIREFIAKPRPQQRRGSEGLMTDKDGKVIRDDSWLHPSADIEQIKKK
jgi:hypothetical protein